MFLASLFGPFTSLYILGVPGILALMTSGGLLAVYLTHEIQAGVVGVSEMASAAVTTALVALFMFLYFYMTCWKKYEVYFQSTPWVNLHNKTIQTKDGPETYQIRCPFTGRQANMKCPSCQARVYESVLLPSSKLLNVPIEGQVLRWETAKAAIANDGASQAVLKSRAQLDEALEFRGNRFLGCLTSCCIGCSTWQKCFNILPRASLGLAVSSLVLAYLPWGFATFLAQGGKASVVFQIIIGTAAVGFSTAALLIQIQIFMRVNVFLNKYQECISAFKPIMHVPSSRFGTWLARLFSGTPWDPALILE